MRLCTRRLCASVFGGRRPGVAAAAARAERPILAATAAAAASSLRLPARSLLRPSLAIQRRPITAWASAVPSLGADAIEMEVTRHNFAEVLPRVKESIAAADFLSWDCEMTGLFMKDQQGGYLDEIEDRYAELLESSNSFIISQFGLSCFRWEDGGYRASTYNFSIFPRPFENGWDRRFVCQASSLDFLANHGFDFNRFVYDGISYLPAALRDFKLAAIDRNRDRPDILIRKQEDVELVCRLVADVTAWLQGDEETLLLEEPNSYRRAIMYQELRKPQFGSDGPPAFYAERADSEQGKPALLLRRATPEQAKDYERQQREQRIAAIHEAAGFTAVLEAMRDAGKPCIGHNLAFDLAYTLASFARQLPPTWGEFKALTAEWFPGGIYDTKLLARQLPQELIEDTTLGVLHDGLARGELAEKVDAFLSGTLPVADGGGAPAEAAASGDWELPDVAHEAGFTRYEGAQTEKYAHEAGYDAYMTGAVFACLLRLFEARAAGSAAMAVDSQPALDAVAGWKGRMNLSRTDMPYAALLGPDPPLAREHVLYISGWGPERAPRNGGDVVRRLSEDNLGDLRASMVEGGAGALLELANAELAPLVTEVLAKRFPGCAVQPYSAYSDKRRQQRAEAAAAAAAARQQRNGKRQRVEAPAAPAAEAGKAWCSLM